MGWNTRANSSTSTANTSMMPAIIARMKLVNSSCMYCAVPISTIFTPGGRCLKIGSARIFSSAVPSWAPLFRSASSEMRRCWL